MKRENRYALVMSIDALVDEDVAQLLSCPGCRQLMTDCAQVKQVETVYPSLTHPAHASILTGCSPGETGIVRNEIFDPYQSSLPWYNDLPQIRRKTLFQAAHEAGLTTSACRWPVTAKGGAYIDYLVPEIMEDDLRRYDDLAEAYAANGAAPIMKTVVRPDFHILSGNDRPGYDAFAARCAARIVEQYRPNLLMTHPGMVDTARHRFGLFHPEVKAAVALVDQWLGWIVEAYRAAGIYDKTDFIILSDHGQMEVKRRICLNALLVEKGYIQLDEAGKLRDWRVFIGSCGLSAQVFLRDPDDVSLRTEIGEWLSQMAKEGVYGFSEVLTTQEARIRYGLYGDFSFVLETDGFTAFDEDCHRPLVRQTDAGDYRVSHATHGHMPHKGPQPVFLAKGPSFKPGAWMERCSILDIGPTLAAIWGLTLPEAKGRALTELLR